MSKVVIYETNNGTEFSDFYKQGHWIPLNEFVIEVYGLHVAVVLAAVFKMYCMEDGVCKASVRTLAKMSGISHSAAKRVLVMLEDEGLIKRVGGGNGIPIHYVPVPLNGKLRD